MDSRCYKKRNITYGKKHTLRSMCVGFAFFVLLIVLSKFFCISVCPFKNIFGVSCFGCGMTRGFLSILKFDFKSAYCYNILSIPLFCCIAIYFILIVVDILFDKDFISAVEKQLSKKYMYFIYILILIIKICFNVF